MNAEDGLAVEAHDQERLSNLQPHERISAQDELLQFGSQFGPQFGSCDVPQGILSMEGPPGARRDRESVTASFVNGIREQKPMSEFDDARAEISHLELADTGSLDKSNSVVDAVSPDGPRKEDRS